MPKKSNLSVIEKFKKNFLIDQETQCWNWIGGKAARGRYGCLWFNGKNTSAHRISWKLFKGPIPNKIEVCHTCDNGLCINPKHLFLGTHQDNMDDMKKKKRLKPRVGENHHSVKITEPIARLIKIMSNFGYSNKDIAGKLCVEKSIVRHIQQNETWTHIKILT